MKCLGSKLLATLVLSAATLSATAWFADLQQTPEATQPSGVVNNEQVPTQSHPQLPPATGHLGTARDVRPKVTPAPSKQLEPLMRSGGLPGMPRNQLEASRVARGHAVVEQKLEFRPSEQRAFTFQVARASVAIVTVRLEGNSPERVSAELIQTGVQPPLVVKNGIKQGNATGVIAIRKPITAEILQRGRRFAVIVKNSSTVPMAAEISIGTIDRSEIQ